MHAPVDLSPLAAPGKADWMDPSIRDKARAYRALSKHQQAETTPALKLVSTSAPSSGERNTRHHSESVALLLRKAKIIGTSTGSKVGGVKASAGDEQAANIAKAAAMHEEIEARRQEALARRTAAEQQQQLKPQTPQHHQQTPEHEGGNISNSACDQLPLADSPQESHGDKVCLRATPSTVPKRFAATAWFTSRAGQR